MGSQRDVIGRLYAHSHRALRRYVRRMVTSYETADEVVQEAFFRTYQNVGRIDTPRAFLFATARNLAASARRSQKSRRTEAMGDLEPLGIESTDRCPEERALADEELRLLQQAVARLPPQCGAVFSLRIFHSCSYKEIAERLGITPKTVENHIARAVRETHEYLRRRTG
jgi:RNA polymerase sigma factor (sigma-70 family)